jgi:hypothetical protein
VLKLSSENNFTQVSNQKVAFPTITNAQALYAKFSPERAIDITPRSPIIGQVS